ncbi:MAG: DUF2878 domain-containing protein [Gammaproteobacteria bacterium]|nr:DUF2878 domain-containing protein [Gammaproteobacteria bacterium]
MNFLLFQLGWFACVISAASQLEWLALLSIVAVIAIHLILVKERVPELQLILVSGLLGLTLDSLLITLGFFTPINSLVVPGIAPAWLTGLWMLFGITLNHSLSWLHQHYVMAALLGLVFAPLTYWAGHRFGALRFPDGQFALSLAVIGSCWLLVTPLLLRSARFLSRRYLRQNHSSY